MTTQRLVNGHVVIMFIAVLINGRSKTKPLCSCFLFLVITLLIKCYVYCLEFHITTYTLLTDKTPGRRIYLTANMHIHLH